MSDPAPSGMDVLVLDDEPSIRILLQEVLAKDGFQVQMANGMLEAQAICQEKKFDLLVVDKNLPDGNGLEFIEWANDLYSGDCESVIITSYATLESSAEALKIGVADYILKPFGHTTEILGRIRSVAEKLNDRRERLRAEEKQAQLSAAIEHAAAEWRQTVDAIASPILLLTLQGQIMRMNVAAKDILGKSYQEYLGKNIREISSGQPWEQIVNMVDFLSESGVTEPTQVRDEENQKTWDITATLSKRSDADDVIIVVAHDVSEVVNLHELLRHNAVMSAMGSLLGGVAHEVRNPLFGITATLDAFEARYGDREEFQRYFKTLRTELARITDLMKDLLEFGKPISLGLARGSLAGIINNAIEACNASAGSGQVEIATRIPADLPPIRMDENRLLHALQNVLENAIQHSQHGGTILIQATETLVDDRPHVSCVIQDAGPGFQEDDRSRVFEPFFSRRRGGTGLGLSIVQRIVEEHMGTILVGNRPGGGGVVTMQFPALK